jgi:hypothetical protein
MTSSDSAANPPKPSPQEEVLRLVSGAWITQALRAAARLGVAERLLAGPRSAAELAAASGVLPDRMERLLRALASEGVFRRRDDGRYENTPTSATLAPSSPGNVHAVVVMTGEEHYLGWSRFLECLAAPTTAFELHFGEPVFAWYAKHETEARNFNQAMRDYSASQIPAIVRAYDTSKCRRIVDVGGGHGGLLVGLMSRAPDARGVVFDLEQGLAAARASGLDRDPRIELVAGDFFKSVTPGGDLYVLKYILHDWDDERCATILRHIRAGLAPGGKVLVCEVLVGPPNRPDPAKWMDLHMMAMPGGTERTEDEFARLFAKAGLRHVRTIPTTTAIRLLEAEAG